MVRLEIIELATPGAPALDALMSYAAVSDEGQRAILEGLLTTAFDVVQRSADVALLPGKFRVCAEDHRGEVKVYMGGKVESVTDSKGWAVMFNQRGRKVYVGESEYVEVVFTTEVNSADYSRLLPVVLRYATALYDGKEGRELNAILKEC